MKTSIENVAKFLASAIVADDKFDEAERIALAEIAEALDFDTNNLVASVETEVKALINLNPAKLKEALCVASTEVAEGENNLIFEALLEMVLVDGVLTAQEVDILLETADLLAIAQSDAVLMLADMVKEESELKIEF